MRHFWTTLSRLFLIVGFAIVALACAAPNDKGGSNPPPTGEATLAIEPGTAKIEIGKTQQFACKSTVGTAAAEPCKNAVWSSSDKAIATIDADGLAAGLSKGTVTVTAKVGALSATATLEVGTTPPVEKTLNVVEITPPTASIALSTTQSFKAQATYSDGTSEDVTTKATWTSADASVATIDAMGVATGAKPGSTMIGAEFGGKKGTATLTVTTKTIESIEVTPPTISVAPGATVSYTATATLSDGSKSNITSVASWASDTPAVATIKADGSATAIAKGTAKITASLSGKSGTADITVSGATLDKITIAPGGPLSLPLGSKQTFTAQATYSDGTSADVTAMASFSSSVSSRLTFAGSVGTANTLGATDITATLGGKTSNIVKVTVTDSSIVTIDVTPATPADIAIGGTQPFTATATMSSGPPIDVTKTAVWASSNTTVATVASGTGIALAKAGGTTAITAAQGGKTSPPVTLKVKPASVALVTIEVSPVSGATINIGGTQSFTATGWYSDGSTADITNSPATTWDVVDVTNTAVLATIATVTDPASAPVAGIASGYASTAGLTGGKAYVRARQGAVAGRGELTVRETKVTSVTVKCTTASFVANATSLLCIPSGVTFPIYCSAEARYADGTGPLDVTADAAFTSSSATANFSKKAGGKAIFTVVANGKAIIIATIGGVASWTSGAPDPVAPAQYAVLTAGSRTITDSALTGPPGGRVNLGEKVQYHVTGTFGPAIGCPTTSGPELAGAQYDMTPLATYVSTFTSIATASNAEGTVGVVSALAKGTTDIGASLSGLNRTISLTVLDRCVKSLEIFPKNPAVPVRTLLKLSVNATYSDDTVTTLSFGTAPGNNVTFNSMSQVAGSTLSLVGDTVIRNTFEYIAGTAAGSTAVTASLTAANGACGTGTLTSPTNTITRVTTGVATALTLDPPSQTIPRGGVIAFSAKATFGPLGTFNVSVPSTAACTGGCPFLSAVSYGESPDLGFSKAYWFTDATGNVCPAIATCGGGSLVYVWTHATPFTAGVSTVNATLGSQTKSSTITVSGKGVASVVVNGSSMGTNVPAGVKPRINVTVTYTDGTTDNQDSLTGITYQSSDPAKISFASAGSNVATANAAGVTQITATVAGILSAPLSFTVNSNVLCKVVPGLGAGGINPMVKNATIPLSIRGDYGAVGCSTISQPLLDISNVVSSSSGDASTVSVTTDSAGTRATSFDKLAALPPGIVLSFSKDGVVGTFAMGVAGDGCVNGVTITDPPSTLIVPRGAPVALKINCTYLGSMFPSQSQAGTPNAVPETKFDESQLAAILYTSGTTAKPKGVVYTHGSLSANNAMQTETFGFTPADVHLVSTAACHAAAFTGQLLPAVFSGGTSVLTHLPKPEEVVQAIQTHNVTRVQMLPASLEDLVEHLEQHPGADLRSLRCVTAGGDVVPVELHRRFVKAVGFDITELCGMTEALSYCTNPPFGAKRLGSIGKPAANARMRLVDDKGHDVPIGQTGEILVATPAMTVGYWNNPQATAEALRDGWLYTGDLGRQDEDGYYWFVGRKKEIIIRGGSNISPLEVEEVIDEHPAVHLSCVVGVPDKHFGEIVAAYVALRHDVTAKPTVEELRKFVADRIASYKVPERITIMDDLPLNATGKVDRKKLHTQVLAEQAGAL